jgi:DNA-binding MarR family transcriptional regulator
MSNFPSNNYEDSSPYRLVHDVYVLLEYGDKLILDSYSLTSTQFRVLNLLDTIRGQRLTQLSERVLRSKSQLTRIVDSLEDKGLIRRVEDRGDRRAQLIVLSETGKAINDRAKQEHATSLAARFGSLDPQERSALVALLEKLKHSMANHLELEELPK